MEKHNINEPQMTHMCMYNNSAVRNGIYAVQSHIRSLSIKLHCGFQLMTKCGPTLILAPGQPSRSLSLVFGLLRPPQHLD